MARFTIIHGALLLLLQVLGQTTAKTCYTASTWSPWGDVQCSLQQCCCATNPPNCGSCHDYNGKSCSCSCSVAGVGFGGDVHSQTWTTQSLSGNSGSESAYFYFNTNGVTSISIEFSCQDCSSANDGGSLTVAAGATEQVWAHPCQGSGCSGSQTLQYDNTPPEATDFINATWVCIGGGHPPRRHVFTATFTLQYAPLAPTATGPTSPSTSPASSVPTGPSPHSPLPYPPTVPPGWIVISPGDTPIWVWVMTAVGSSLVIGLLSFGVVIWCRLRRRRAGYNPINA